MKRVLAGLAAMASVLAFTATADAASAPPLAWQTALEDHGLYSLATPLPVFDLRKDRAHGYVPIPGSSPTEAYAASNSDYQGYSIKYYSVVAQSQYIDYLNWKQVNNSLFYCGDGQQGDVRTAVVRGGVAITPGGGCTVYIDAGYLGQWRWAYGYGHVSPAAEDAKETLCSVIMHEEGHSWLHILHNETVYPYGIGPVMSPRSLSFAARKTQVCKDHWGQANLE